MDRITLIGELITGKKLTNYLEIGVFNGRVFFRVKSTFKTVSYTHLTLPTNREV